MSHIDPLAKPETVPPGLTTSSSPAPISPMAPAVEFNSTLVLATISGANELLPSRIAKAEANLTQLVLDSTETTLIGASDKTSTTPVELIKLVRLATLVTTPLVVLLAAETTNFRFWSPVVDVVNNVLAVPVTVGCS